MSMGTLKSRLEKGLKMVSDESKIDSYAICVAAETDGIVKRMAYLMNFMS